METNSTTRLNTNSNQLEEHLAGIEIQYSPDSDSESQSDSFLDLALADINPSIIGPIQKINLDLINDSNWLRVGHLNASSVPKHIHEIRRIVKEADFDILGISETFIKEHTPENRVNIDNYKLFKFDREHTTQGGVALYVKTDIYVEQYKIPTHIAKDKNAPEITCVILTINRTKIAVVCIYRTPKLPYKSIELLTEVIGDICCKYTHTIFVGDYNVNQLDKNSPQYKHFQNTIIEPLALTQVITKPTRITNTTNTLIDLILTSVPENVMQHGTTELPGVSDHHIVYITYALKRPKTVVKKIVTRDMSKFSEQAFLDDCDTAPWHLVDVFQENDIQNRVTVLENVTLDLINKHAPYKEKIIKENGPKWLSNTIQKAMDARDKLKTHCNSTRKPSDITKFKDMRNKVSHMIRKAQKKHFNNQINKCIDKPKLFYSNLKKEDVICDKKKNNECKHSATYLNQTFLKNNNAKEDEIKINNEIQSILQKTEARQNPFEFKPITEAETKKIIRSLKSKSSGVDDIGGQFVKIAINHIAGPLTGIINACFKHRIFPDRWKNAIVKPIPKTNNPLLPTDYRPISLLTVFSKIHEKAATYQIVLFLKESNQNDKNQSAYKSNHSTNTALLKITDDIYNAMDDSEVTVLVLLDYSKAFDTINHRLLYAKLKYLGFHSSAVSWIISYLTGRKQKVKTLSDESGWEEVKNGVPQGSVLGPLLFSILVHDISTYIPNSQYHMYADDTQIYYHCILEKIHETIIKINEDLKKVCEFSDKNCLKINPDKSNFIVIGTKKQTDKAKALVLKVKVNNVEIERKTITKNLGVYFDENMNWQKQISEITRKANFKLRQLYRFKRFMTQKCKHRVIETYVLSQLNYCDSIYQGATQQCKGKLQKLQNSCIRFICSLKRRDHITPHIKSLNILNIESRTKCHALMQMHKIIKKTAPSYLISKVDFRRNTHSHNTRNREQINIKRLKKSIKKGAFFQQTAKDYNYLLGVKIIDTDMSLNRFKKTCKSHFLNSQSQL